MQENLQELYGNIDIYLFDQLLKGTYASCKSILDAGCGTGRNLHYFLKQDFEVFGVDADPESIAHVRALSGQLAPKNPADNFRIGQVENLPFPNQMFDLVISSAVLHFAKDPQHFEAMLSAMWRVLRPEGYLFVRLASDIGIKELVQPLGTGRFLLPDGSERFLVNQEMLLSYTAKLNGTLHEPIKTTNVQNLRCMTTWCLQKL